MYKRAFCWACAALFFFFCACAFLITCRGVDASAAETYTKMSAADFRSIIGDSLPFSYVYQGSSFSSSFSYYSSNYSYLWDNGGMNIDSNSVFTSVSSASQYDTIVYRSKVMGSGLYENISIDCLLRFSGGARGGVMLAESPGSVSNPDAATNMISIGGNYWGDFSALSANPAASANLADYYAIISARTPDSGYLCDFRPILYDSTDFTLDGIHFNSVQSSSYRDTSYLYLVFFCPYSYGEISNEPAVTTTSPVTTAPSGSGTDMSETNGLLGRILAAIQGIAQSILDGIKGLFIPDDDFMDGFKDDMSNLLENHLGGLYEAEQIMVDAFGRFPDVAAKSEIYIPPATLNLAGTPFTVGDWHVPLKVQGVPALLYDGIAFIIDFLCLAAFLRMCRNKLEIFLNPDSEVVKE